MSDLIATARQNRLKAIAGLGSEPRRSRIPQETFHAMAAIPVFMGTARRI